MAKDTGVEKYLALEDVATLFPELDEVEGVVEAGKDEVDGVQRRGKGYVYLIVEENMKLFKVGLTNKPYRRIGELERETNFKLIFWKIEKVFNMQEAENAILSAMGKVYQHADHLGREWYWVSGPPNEIYSIFLEIANSYRLL